MSTRVTSMHFYALSSFHALPSSVTHIDEYTRVTSMHFHALSSFHALTCRVTHIDEYTRDEFLADLSERFTPQSYR